MRYIITFFLMAAGTLVTQAATPSDSSVNELMNVMQVETLLNQTLKQMNDGLGKGMEQGVEKSLQGKELNTEQKAALEKFRTKFARTLKEELSMAEVKDIYLQAYKEIFTQEEVDAMTVFYKSPAGRAVTEKYPAAMQKANALMQTRYGPLARKFQGMLDDLAHDLEAAK